MSEPRRELPSITALHCFVVSAEQGSFSRAGDLLGLTQSAVSRQIAILEQALQCPLFDRHGRRIALNEAGRAYLADVAPALARIRTASRAAMRRGGTRVLTIATLPSFGMRWLAPRLPGLTAQHPDLTVNFAARSFAFDLDAEGFDAAIHFGDADWPDADHVPLFAETAIVVAAPDWLARHAIAGPADLLAHPLLFQVSRMRAWNQWFAAAGVAGLAPLQGPSFEHFLMLAQAAVAGAGAALLPRFLVLPELASGALVAPFATELTDTGHYYLVMRRNWREHRALARFADWVTREASA